MSTAPSSNLPRLLVLISGNGSNLQALIDATTSGSLQARIIHVISNKKNAYGLTRAKNAGVPTSYHNLLPYKSRYAAVTEARKAYDADLAQLIIAQKPDLVVCAGWMHILSPEALTPLEEAAIDIINLHPALPGQFDGAHAIERAYEAFKKGEITATGIMIHYVIVAVDRGQPILVREIPIGDESLEELEQKIHGVEHEAIVEGTKLALQARSQKPLA